MTNASSSWQAADHSAIYWNLKRMYPESPKSWKLEQTNYRSTKPFLDAAWNVVKHTIPKKKKKALDQSHGPVDRRPMHRIC